MIDPEIELHPQAIIARGKQREAKFNFVKSVLLDIFIVNLRDIPFSWNTILIMFVLSIIIGYVWTYSRTSLSAKLFGIAKDNNVTKWTVEIFGWFLFNITFIAGWIVTKISIVDLFSSEGIQGAQRIFSA